MQHQLKEIKSVGNSRELYRAALTGLLIYNEVTAASIHTIRNYAK
jgi:hypothetical protein